ncbi:MAG: dienelactone hydrolase family protein [Opitutales bacterium]
MKNIVAGLLVLAAMSPLSAKIVVQPVPYQHDGAKLEGVLVYDSAKTAAGKLPGVLVLPEWWGLTDYPVSRARQLAAMGYVAFAADMYGAGVTTTDPKRAGALAGPFYGKPLMAARARAGLDQLLASGLVDGQRVAAIGFCFGGSTAMALAYSGAPLVGIVSFHGGPIPATPEAAARNHAKFLICHGAADPFTPKEQLDGFLASLDENHIDYEFALYSGAKHAFTNPEATKLAQATGLTGIGYDAEAAGRSWQLMRDFLQEVFR